MTSYVFRIDDYTIIFSDHHNGKLVEIERDNHDCTFIFGVTTHSCYSLYEFDWLDMEKELIDEENYDPPYYDSDIEKAATILINNIDGGTIGDRDGEIHLTYAMSEFLIIFTIDLLTDDDMSWIEIPNENCNNNDNEDPVYILTQDCLIYKGKEYPFPSENKINSYEFRSILSTNNN